MKNKGDKTMKKVLLTSAVALAAFGAVQAVSADSSFDKLVADALGITAPAATTDTNGLTMDQYNAVKGLVKTLREANVALENAKKTHASVEAKFEEAKKAYSDAVYAVRTAKANNVAAQDKKDKIVEVRGKIAADFAGDLSKAEDASNTYGVKTQELTKKTKQLGSEADTEGAKVAGTKELTAYANLKKTTKALEEASAALEKYLSTSQPIAGAPAADVKQFNERRVELEKAKSDAEVAKQEAATTVDTLKKEVKDLKDAKQAADKQLKVLDDAIEALTKAVANGTGSVDGKTLTDLNNFVTEKHTALTEAAKAVEDAEVNLNAAKSAFDTAKKNAEDAYKTQKLPFVLEDILKPAQPTPEPAPLQFGWNKDAKGNWTYVVDSKGKKATGWVNDKGTWYYLNAEGVMQTGWVKDGNTWYYLKDNGAMATGWVKDGNTWYYLNSNGAMATGWVKDNGTWYYLKSSGAMATGWYQVGGKWYYSYASGALAVNTTVDGYTVNGNGEWV